MTKPTRFPNELLREQRLRRGWSLDHMADQLRRLASRLGESEPGVDGNMISRWERGLHRPGPRYVRLLRLLYDEAPEGLGLLMAAEDPVAGRASETFELAMQATASGLDQAAIDLLMLGTEAEILKPRELRRRIAAATKAMAALNG